MAHFNLKEKYMGGFFGTISRTKCITDLFYGTDYNSHLGTRRGGMATYSEEHGFSRSIHNLESTYFRTRFESELDKFKGNAGIGIISDTDAQPMLMNSHLGRFALVTVARINNIEEIAQKLLSENMHLSEFSSGRINPTALIALLIIKGKTYVDGIENVFRTIKGSFSIFNVRRIHRFVLYHFQRKKLKTSNKHFRTPTNFSTSSEYSSASSMYPNIFMQVTLS